jgi:hypothetical protein
MVCLIWIMDMFSMNVTVSVYSIFNHLFCIVVKNIHLLWMKSIRVHCVIEFCSCFHFKCCLHFFWHYNLMRTLRRPRHTWRGCIKVDLKEIGLGSGGVVLVWIRMAQDKDQCWALVNVAMSVNSSMLCRKFLACVTHY